MPVRPASDVSQVVQAAPIIQVPNPETTAEYYRDILGFNYDFGSDMYAIVWRENAAIHFAQGEPPASGVRIFLWVNDADAILEELQKTGAEISVEIGDREYGVRDFGIVDCNGLDLVIGQDID